MLTAPRSPLHFTPGRALLAQGTPATLMAALFVAGCGPAARDGIPPELPAAEYGRLARALPPIAEDPPGECLALAQGSSFLSGPPARSAPAPEGWSPADSSAPTTLLVKDAGRLGHDPQVAVSDRFLIVYTSHTYGVYDKGTGALLPPDPAGLTQPSGDFNTIFLPVWSARDAAGQPNPACINNRLRFTESDPFRCDPDSPRRGNACVQEFYDTRIMWDGLRKRFWIESAARNHLWDCRAGDPCDGDKQSRTQGRRYIAIAVSRTEDPRQGFHTYMLVEEYADWPTMAINDHYLVLGHRSSQSLYVFDADRLAAGNPDQGPVRLARLDGRHFPGTRHVTPVTHHGDTRGVTYLLGTDNSNAVVPFALVNPELDRAGRPVIVSGPRVDTGQRLSTMDGNAVYRNGSLSWTFSQWVPGHEKEAHQLRILRMPVRPTNTPEGPRLWASADPGAGFRSVAVGGREPDEAAEDLFDYQKPALDVNGGDDLVVVFARRSVKAQAPVAPEVRYAILYHGESVARPSVLVRRGGTSAVPDIDDNGKSGIDLAYAQVDPADDRTVWVTHAYADGKMSWWRQVVAAVKP